MYYDKCKKTLKDLSKVHCFSFWAPNMLKISKQVTVESASAVDYFKKFKHSVTGQCVCALLLTIIKCLILNVLDFFSLTTSCIEACLQRVKRCQAILKGHRH